MLGPAAAAHGLRVYCIALAAVFFCQAGLGQEAPRYYPLDVGNSWTFKPHSWPEGPPQFTVNVLSREGNTVTIEEHLDLPGLDTCFFQITLYQEGSDLDILLDDLGRMPFYSFDSDEFEHFDYGRYRIGSCRVVSDPCNHRQLTVRKIQSVSVPAGSFSDCLMLVFQGERRCADAGRLLEIWCPEVGLVEWQDIFSGGISGWVLTSFELHQETIFIRGDPNSDGKIDLGDAVFILEYLFLDRDEISCPDSADTDDNGGLEITDSIALLQHLFLGGFPKSDLLDKCLGDPSVDALPDCGYAHCAGTGA